MGANASCTPKGGSTCCEQQHSYRGVACLCRELYTSELGVESIRLTDAFSSSAKPSDVMELKLEPGIIGELSVLPWHNDEVHCSPSAALGVASCRDSVPTCPVLAEVALQAARSDSFDIPGAVRSVSSDDVNLEDKEGRMVRIRTALLSDKRALVEQILDNAAAGPGHSVDPVLVNLFDDFLVDADMLILWAEEAEPPGRSLGMVGITVCSRYESFLHSLRVSAESRDHGIEEMLFRTSCELCARMQGPHSRSRWKLSRGPRSEAAAEEDAAKEAFLSKQLSGPAAIMTRFVGLPALRCDLRAALPRGWTCRAAVEGDVPSILAHVNGEDGSFETFGPDFGTVNIVRYGAVCALTTEVLHRIIPCWALSYAGSEEPHTSLRCTKAAPLAFDEEGRLVGFSVVCIRQSPANPHEGQIMLFGYTGGTRRGIQVMFDVLRHQAAEDRCARLLGFVPTLDWLLEDMSKAKDLWRGPQAQVFSWTNRDFIT